MKEPKKAYTTPRLIVHGTVETMTMAKSADPGDAFATPPGRARGKDYSWAEDAFRGRSGS